MPNNFWIWLAVGIGVLCGIRAVQVLVLGRVKRRHEEDSLVAEVAAKETIRQAAAYWVGLVKKLVASGEYGPMTDVASRLEDLERCFRQELARRCLRDGYYPRLWHYHVSERCPNHPRCDDVFSCALRAVGITRCPWLLLPATVVMAISEEEVRVTCSTAPDEVVWSGTTGDTRTFRPSYEERADYRS